MRRLWSKRSWVRVGVILLVTLASLLVVAQYYATHLLKLRIEEALGSHGTVGEIRLGFSALEIVDLRIRASEQGWPVGDELRARRVVIYPALSTLLDKTVRIDRIEAEGIYLSILRRRSGKTVLLPSLLGGAASSLPVEQVQDRTKTASAPGNRVHLGVLELSGGVIEFFDASVRRIPHRLRLEQVGVRLDNLRIPELTGATSIKADGRVKGPRQDGRFSIRGTAELANYDSQVNVNLQGVDLLALQPYLLNASDGGVRRGVLDLELRATIRDRRLNAPGVLTLSHLELAPGGRLMGASRDLVLNLLRDRQGRIVLKFTLEGKVDDPSFSLNESLTDRMAASLAGAFGVDLERLSQGVGRTGSGVVKGLSDSVQSVLRRR